MKIASWNVNSIRRRLPLVLEWLTANQPDVLCLQETKVEDANFPELAFTSAGYRAAFHGMKAYNGVATLTRTECQTIRYRDARLLHTEVDGIPILNTYVPQGYSISSEKYSHKLQWLEELGEYFEAHLDPKKPAVWLGDMNVAPESIDVYHPEKRVNDVDFHIDARNAFKRAAEWGFVDTFRKMHPEAVQYTYWDYFRDAFKRNFGWRIDHIMTTAPLADRCVRIEVDMEARKIEGSSDHTVIWAEFK